MVDQNTGRAFFCELNFALAIPVLFTTVRQFE